MAELVEAKVSHTFKASPERVFDAWLHPDMVRRWMRMALKRMGLAGEVSRVEIDAREGGRFTFADMREGGEAVHWGTYLEVDRPTKLVFTWFTSEEDERENASVVTLTIEPTSEGCTGTIVHTMDAKYAEYVERTESGWGRMLEQIDVLLEAEA